MCGSPLLFVVSLIGFGSVGLHALSTFAERQNWEEWEGMGEKASFAYTEHYAGYCFNA